MAPSPDRKSSQARLFLLETYLDERRSEIIERWGKAEYVGPVWQEIFVFVITSHATVEELCSSIIVNHVIDDDFSDGAANYVYSGMSQSHREKLLSECGILGDQTIGQLSDFRALRNKIAHEPRMGIDWEGDDVEERINCVMEVIGKLRSANQDKERIVNAIEDGGI